MTGHNLWYFRRGDKVAGPFPAHLISDQLLLGRLKPDDEVSADKMVWQRLADVAELVPRELPALQAETDPEQRRWLEERLKAAHRWADERTHEERRHRDEAGPAAERRHGVEDPDVLALPHMHPALAMVRSKWRYIGAAAAILTIVLAVWGLLSYRPVNPVKVGVIPVQAQCRAKAAPRVNWSGCDEADKRLRGVDLDGSDLSYASFARTDLSGSRLSRAKLTGANFTGSDLGNADLRASDLSNADLRGANLLLANLSGAVLDHAMLDQAIWSDGRVCAAGSVGQCL